MDPVRIVVLGAGYAGLTAFLELQHRLPRRGYDLVLINSSPYHYFVTELHTLAAGVEEEEHLRVPLRRVVRPPGRLVVAAVRHIDLQSRQVLVEGQPPIPYDYCLIGLGSDPEYYNLPGVSEHGMPVGTAEAARALRRRLEELLDQYPDRPLQVCIAGGGLTGVEVAGEMADAHPGRLAISLIEAGPQIMPGFDPFLVSEARRVLEEKGIRILTGMPIARVDGEQLYMKDGTSLPYDLFVWAGGVRGSGILAESGLPTTRKGRVPVDAYLRAREHSEVYLIGDAASFCSGENCPELPPTAQAAVQMGRHAARNLLRRLAGKEEQPFVPHIRGAFASLGQFEGVGYLGNEPGRVFTGLPAAVVKRLIEAQHAYEAGGVVPIVGQLLRPAARLLHRAVRRSAAPMPPYRALQPTNPEPPHELRPH